MKQKIRAAEILIALVVLTSMASERPVGPLMGTGCSSPDRCAPVPPENLEISESMRVIRPSHNAHRCSFFSGHV